MKTAEQRLSAAKATLLYLLEEHKASRDTDLAADDKRVLTHWRIEESYLEELFQDLGFEQSIYQDFGDAIEAASGERV